MVPSVVASVREEEVDEPAVDEEEVVEPVVDEPTVAEEEQNMQTS